MFYVDWPKSLQYLFIIIDIFLVSLIFYYIIKYIFNTKTINILKGTIAVAGAFFIAIFFKLKTLLWFFEKAFEFLPLAIIIVFQPEIRRILSNLGTLKLFSGLDKTQQEKNNYLIQKLIPAIGLLSEKQIGALILIEQQIGLNHIKENSVPIHAEVSKELLMSIFMTTSPLHDGAVIIHNNKLEVARAFFPITEEKVMASLGSRHRAGLGISELTDAIALIVSEETGHISVSYLGKIYYNLTLIELKEKLLQILSKKHEK
jgi:diadenylate cyclase